MSKRWRTQQPERRSDRQVSVRSKSGNPDNSGRRRRGEKRAVTKPRAPSCPGVLGGSSRRNGNIFNVSPCAELLLLTVATRSSSAVRVRPPLYRLPVALANLQSPDVHSEILHTTALALSSTPTHNLLAHLRDCRFPKSDAAAIQLHGTLLTLFA
ncbi:hypothetical protein Q9L58_005809 [Maublancomyces gigas]|uniref:Uncharacterized protein n=1 Tax=Discina gigas TaxID=1032678 RepID=A0ABR3GHC7_9PEZI